MRKPASTWPDRHLVEERRERGSERGRRVALDEERVGTYLLDERAQARKRAHRDVGERLAVLHDVEIVVRNDAEQGEHLVEHLAMLRRDRHDRLELPAALPEPSSRPEPS